MKQVLAIARTWASIPRGLEPEDVTNCKSSNLQNQEESSDAKSGAPDTPNTPQDPQAPDLLLVLERWPDLAEIVAVWPSLPEAIKAGIVAMVRAARTETLQ